MGFPGDSDGKESACNAETWVRSLGWEDPLEEGMATHSSFLAWRIPWIEEPGGLQSVGMQSTTSSCLVVMSFPFPIKPFLGVGTGFAKGD